MTYHTCFTSALFLDKQKKQTNSPEIMDGSSLLAKHPRVKRISIKKIKEVATILDFNDDK